VIDSRHRNTALLVAGCFFMENLDNTIVTTSAPKMGEALHVLPTAIGLVITGYVLALAVFIPLSGWLTQRFGARPIFLTAIAVFTLASLACGTSVSFGELVVVRVLQGVGGAMMVPVGRMVVLAHTEKPDLIRVMSYIVWPALVAPVIAPLAGGLITTYTSWRWLFLINIPLGAIAMVVGWRLIDRQPARAAVAPLDWWGLILTSVGLGGLTYTAHLLAEPGSSAALAVGLGGGGLLLLAAAIRHLLRVEAPLVNLRTLRVPTFRVAQAGGSLFRIAVAATPFLLPLLFQNVFGWSPVKSGAVVMFLFVGNIGIKPATTWLLTRFGFRTVLIASTGAVAVLMVAAGFTTADTPLVATAAVVMLSGVARSVGLTAYSTLGFGDIPPEQMPGANALTATCMNLAQAFGIAASAVALHAGEPLAHLVTAAPSLDTGYRIAFVLIALAVLPAVVEAVRLHPKAGEHLHQPKRSKRSTAAG
jgi:EmrB/QacA subfamily drug resistance transporter